MRANPESDIAELRTAQGKLHLFVAADRVTKSALVPLHGKATAHVGGDFPRVPVAAVPYRVHTVLTDLRLKFTFSREPGSTVDDIKQAIAAGELFRAHAFDYACAQLDIEHRLTKPKHANPVRPRTSGQVERMNRTIKDATVKRFNHDDHDQLRSHPTGFVGACNYPRRLTKLQGLTPCEAICRAWTEEPTGFTLDPLHQVPGLKIWLSTPAPCARLRNAASNSARV